MSSSSDPKAPPRVSAKSTTDPILRNALRYTISAKEYETLHKYIITRSKVLKRNTPSVSRVEKLIQSDGDGYNAAAVRASVRVFVATSAGLKVWALLKERLMGVERVRNKQPFYRSPNFRLSLSLSTILLLHRLLFRFFTRLRAQLLTPEAHPFRQRNKRTARTLTSSLAPAIGASLAGFALAIQPADQLRITISIYALARAAEFAYNLAEEEGWIWSGKGWMGRKPWWWGSWLLMPVASGQLLHAFVFDRDCFPKAYGDFILKSSTQYIQPRPEDYPATLSWPGPYEVVDSLAEMARLNYPKFTSPILFPNSTVLPPTLTQISPITSPAHPLLTSLSCALLHPSDPSCTRTYIRHHLTTIPRLARLFTIIFSVLSLPSYAKFLATPLTALNALAARILRYTIFTSGSIGTSWSAICLFQSLLSPKFLSTQRFFLGGFIGGLWAFVVRKEGKGEFLYAARASVESVWKVGRKRGWWKGIKGGDVALFVMGLGMINVAYEREAEARRGKVVDKNLGRGVKFLRGDGTEVEEIEETREKA